jgi:hypothetical protein
MGGYAGHGGAVAGGQLAGYGPSHSHAGGGLGGGVQHVGVVGGGYAHPAAAAAAAASYHASAALASVAAAQGMGLGGMAGGAGALGGLGGGGLVLHPHGSMGLQVGGLGWGRAGGPRAAEGARSRLGRPVSMSPRCMRAAGAGRVSRPPASAPAARPAGAGAAAGARDPHGAHGLRAWHGGCGGARGHGAAAGGREGRRCPFCSLPCSLVSPSTRSNTLDLDLTRATLHATRVSTTGMAQMGMLAGGPGQGCQPGQPQPLQLAGYGMGPYAAYPPGTHPMNMNKAYY